MTKFIIFDLDGVLISAKKIHFDTLNEALGTKDAITWDEHLAIYDGLKTNQKLEMLTTSKGLPRSVHKRIWETKQKLTLERLAQLTVNYDLQRIMASLSQDGYKIAVCSNSIRKTVLTVLAKLGIIEYMDLVLSNEDVRNSKPHPEMYWKAMAIMNFIPAETLIIEDSPNGLLAAARSKAHIMRVTTPKDVTYTNIIDKINQMKTNSIKQVPKWTDNKLNVLIPMAGAGSRFEKAGYTFPKPLIEVDGKPRIQAVVENLNIDANFIYVVQKSYREMYNLDTLLNLITPNCKIVEVDGITEGAACTALLASKYICNDNPLFFANSDQIVDWDSNEFMYKMNETDADGGIVTFTATHPKWSFVRINDKGLVTEVAEKNPISDMATVGFYYWKKGRDFVENAEQMIERDVRVNGEFYIAPVFNEAIQNDLEIRTFHVDTMFGIGIPEDLEIYLNSLKK